MLNSNVLILNQNYEPLSICSVRRALMLIFRGKAQMVEKSDMVFHSVSQAFSAPSVVRLERYIHTARRRVVLSKRNILRRDNFECQYCGVKNKIMTVDHVVPRKDKGQTSWENLVCACVACNSKKGDRRPEQVGLQLSRSPKRPNSTRFIQNFIGISDQRWKPYLFLD